MATVVALIVLRMSLGVHFLYEGVWKITHPEFSAEGFLTQAKGPASWIFYAMVPDIDGSQRLAIVSRPNAEQLLAAWQKASDDAGTRYEAYVTKDKAFENKQEAIDQFRMATARLYWDAEADLEDWLDRHEAELIGWFADRHEKPADAESSDAETAKVKAWIAEIGQIEQDFVAGLQKMADEGDQHAKEAMARSISPTITDVGEKTAIDRLVDGDRLVTPKRREILRVDEGVRAETFYARWDGLRQKAIAKFDLDEKQQYEANRLFHRYKTSAIEYLDDNQPDIAAYLGSLDRHQQDVAADNNGAPYKKKRNWDEMMKLRGEAGVWLGELEQMGNDFRDALWNTLDADQQARGSLSYGWTQVDLINLAVTFALTAIGFCLLVGLGTRFAAIGGGGFMCFVVLTQPAWPTIYPPDPAVVGHALLINKDFIEMVALFLIATTAVGRWAGLDYFLENAALRVYRQWANTKNQ